MSMLSIADELVTESEAHSRPGRVRAHLAELLKSAPFRRAPGLRKLLAFVVESTLAAEGPTLKEYTLGAEGLSRGTDFDPRIDPIVRVQMRKVRMRLERYYGDTATNHPVRIVLRKGGYTPQFHFAEERVESNGYRGVVPVNRPRVDPRNAVRWLAAGM